MLACKGLRMAQARVFRIGTFNLYNLVLPKVTYYGNRRLSQQVYDRKLQWIVGQLRTMNASVIGFQECFHVQALQSAIGSSGIYSGAQIVAADRTNPTDGSPLPSNALVSLFPVVNMRMISQFPARARVNYGGQVVPIEDFSRPVLYAQLQIHEHLVHVFIAHLKSKRPIIEDGEDAKDPFVEALGKTRALIRRAAEAVALRTMIIDIARTTTAPVIVLGDLNDDARAVTNDVIAGSEPWRNLKFEEKKRIWDVFLYNTKDIVARRSYQDVYYTHIYNGHFDSLDHILVSEEWIAENRKGRIGVVEGIRLYNDHLIDDTQINDPTPAWQSDHAQVVAQIELDEPVPQQPPAPPPAPTP
jgi:hypothetical protein